MYQAFASPARCAVLRVFSGVHTAEGVVDTLLELGADVNKDDGDPEVRYTPLHSAVANEVRALGYPRSPPSFACCGLERRGRGRARGCARGSLAWWPLGAWMRSRARRIGRLVGFPFRDRSVCVAPKGQSEGKQGR